MRNYYITRSGRLARQDNTLYLEVEEDGKTTKTPIPIEDVDALYLYGEINLNTRLLNFWCSPVSTLQIAKGQSPG